MHHPQFHTNKSTCTVHPSPAQGRLISRIYQYLVPGFPGFFEVDFALLFRVGSILFGDERKSGGQLSFVSVYRLQLTLQQGDNSGDI